MGEFVFGGLQSAGGLLLGRKTFEIFAGYWPNQPEDDAIAKPINAMPKVRRLGPRSRTRSSGTARRCSATTSSRRFNRLREAPGGDLLVIGSGQLAQTLMREGLVDAYQLMVYPLLLGGGKRLFRGENPKQKLGLTGSETSPNGVVILTYEPTGD
jgi:dihydrofolate reductase